MKVGRNAKTKKPEYYIFLRHHLAWFMPKHLKDTLTKLRVLLQIEILAPQRGQFSKDRERYLSQASPEAIDFQYLKLQSRASA